MPRIEENARNEDFWHAIAERYDMAPGPVNLENGYFGRMTRGVAQDYQRNIDFINRNNSVHVRQQFDGPQNIEIRNQLAGMLWGCTRQYRPHTLRFGRTAIADWQLQELAARRSVTDQ